jgi:DNA-directed RNA polymerase subunit L
MSAKLTITDVKLEKIDYRAILSGNSPNEKRKRDILEKCMTFARKVHPAPEKLIPRPIHALDFKLEGTSPAFANALRRCLIDELPVKVLSFDLEDLETDDAYILPDVLVNQIGYIPIAQNDLISSGNRQTAQAEISKASLLVVNNTTEIINVTTSDIKFANTTMSKELFDPQICITKLHPMKYLSIRKFKLIEGRGLENSGFFNLLANVRFSSAAVSSVLSAIPTSFTLGYTTYGNIDPLEPILMSCNELTRRLNLIKNGLSEAAMAANLDMKTASNPTSKSTSGILNNNQIQIEYQAGDMVHVIIENESWTLANLISSYCYKLQEDIPFVTPFVAPTLDNRAIIKIVFPQWRTLILDSIAHIIDDLNVVSHAFASRKQ